MSNVSNIERTFWGLVNTAFLILTVILLKYLWNDYLRNPTIVTSDSANRPIQQITYPGVAICNINKISKRRAVQFVQNMNSRINKKDKPINLDDIKLLGHLYDFNLDGQERFTQFQEILEDYDNDTNNLFYPVNRLLELSTPCEEMLQHCSWGGRAYNCEELFLTRMTFDGFCCIFNYARPSQRVALYGHLNKIAIPKKAEVSQGIGIINGLEVILNNDLEDYLYTSMESAGFVVHIFHSQDFPDLLSGSLSEIIVNLGREALIDIGVDVIEASPMIRPLPIYLRKCKFESDDYTFFGKYTPSDCFVECKMRTIISLCNCIPFTVPVVPGQTSVCSLIDIPCLNKFKGKWSKYQPLYGDMDNLEKEKYDSISCPKCLPACTTMEYSVYVSSSHINSSDGMSEHTKINIYMSKPFANEHKIDLTITWYEVLSSFGGMISLLMGLSIISIIEVIALLYRVMLYYVCNFLKKY